MKKVSFCSKPLHKIVFTVVLSLAQNRCGWKLIWQLKAGLWCVKRARWRHMLSSTRTLPRSSCVASCARRCTDSLGPCHTTRQRDGHNYPLLQFSCISHRSCSTNALRCSFSLKLFSLGARTTHFNCHCQLRGRFCHLSFVSAIGCVNPVGYWRWSQQIQHSH